MLLFGKNPQALFINAQIHMGRFRDDITIIDDKLLKSNLFTQLEGAVQLFRTYLQVRYEFEGTSREDEPLSAMQRREIWDYPIEALREAVVNALIDEDYFSADAKIQVRVYDDRMIITNPVNLLNPASLTGRLRLMQYPKGHGAISNKTYRKLADVTGRTALRDLKYLINRNIC